mgnify:CR=1 FL=1
MKTPRIYLAALLIATVPWVAGGAEETAMPERGPIPFEAYDQNGDGYVTQMEFTESRNKRIEEKARQGYPLRGLKEQGAPAFAAFDGDGDGKLTREELEAGQLQRWQEQRQQRWEEKSPRSGSPMGGRGGPNR